MIDVETLFRQEGEREQPRTLKNVGIFCFSCFSCVTNITLAKQELKQENNQNGTIIQSSWLEFKKKMIFSIRMNCTIDTTVEF